MDAVLLETVRTFDATSEPSLQVPQLRAIKNDTVGHNLRKELVITNGLLAKLEHVLAAAAKGKSRQESGCAAQDEAHLQTILIIDILASGGPSFLSPILLSNAVSHLFAALTVRPETPVRITLAALRALNSLAKSSNHLSSATYTSGPSPLSVQAFTKVNSTRLVQLLKTPLQSFEGPRIVELTAKFIASVCDDDHSRALMTKLGVLETLAGLLANYALANQNGFSLLRLSTMTEILDAISAVIQNSTYRTHRLMLASAFRRTFTSQQVSSIGTPSGVATPSGLAADRQSTQLNFDRLLPKISVPTPVKSIASLVSQQGPSLHSSSDYLSPELGFGNIATVDPFCTWLIHLSRSVSSSSARLSALQLLSQVISACDREPQSSKPNSKWRARERQITLLALPVAVRLIQEAIASFKRSERISPETRRLQTQACSTLALLIRTLSSDMQKAAVEAGAIKHVSMMLRKTFEPIETSRGMWSAQTEQLLLPSTIPSAQMGPSGLSAEIEHVMRVRAGALKAIAAIANREDAHRKAIIDQGVVNFIIESLKPITDTSLESSATLTRVCNFNTVPVLVAACEAASTLSRSVSLLRTSLIDAGIAKPVLALLQHADLDVKVAATNVTCNLVLDFSPMRQDLLDAGAMKTLCEHAKQANPSLRVASLWAMKHLVLKAPKDVKIEAFEELGPGWLVQAINGDDSIISPRNDAQGAASDRATLFGTSDYPDMDIDTPDEDVRDDDDYDNDEVRFDQSGTPYQSSGIRSTLKPNLIALSTLRQLRERESDTHLQARRDDIDIQEQALDFIRNLINGDDAPAMIDHLNGTIGLQRIFDMLHTKLEPNPDSATTPSSLAFFTKPTTSLIRPEQAPTPPALIHSVIHIMIHISAASARHKQLLIAQKPLLRAWLPYFAHPDPKIRVICVWVVINLTWVEDQSDREDARMRAMQLRLLGVEDRTKQLATDPELDVRERVKTAARQLDELLSGATGPGGMSGLGIGRR